MLRQREFELARDEGLLPSRIEPQETAKEAAICEGLDAAIRFLKRLRADSWKGFLYALAIGALERLRDTRCQKPLDSNPFL